MSGVISWNDFWNIYFRPELLADLIFIILAQIKLGRRDEPATFLITWGEYLNDLLLIDRYLTYIFLTYTSNLKIEKQTWLLIIILK